MFEARPVSESNPDEKLVQPEEAQEDQPCQFPCESCEKRCATQRALAHANRVHGRSHEGSHALHGAVCVACLTIFHRGREHCNICCVANVSALRQHANISRRDRMNELPKSWRRTGLKNGVPRTTMAAVMTPVYLL